MFLLYPSPLENLKLLYYNERKHTEEWKQQQSLRMSGYNNSRSIAKGNFEFIPYKCKCNCGKFIELKKEYFSAYERKGYPKFINGHHSRGHKDSKETRLLKSINNSMYNPEIKEKHKNIVNSIEFKNNMSKSIKEMWKKPGMKEKQSESMKKIWNNNEYKEMMCKIMKEVRNRPEIKMKTSELLKINNPMFNSETANKISEIQTKLWSDLLYKEKMYNAFENRFTPEVLEQMSGENNHNWNGGREAYIKRRRGLGFIPLNDYFTSSEGHHININDVIYIPEYFHHMINHNVHTGKNMNIINAYENFFLIQQNID